MTAISVFQKRGVPILLSDARISAPNSDLAHVDIPTTEHPEIFAPKYYLQRIDRLQRKLFLLKSDIALAWSGSRIHAKSVMKFLHQESIIYDLGTLKDALVSASSWAKSDLVVLGAVMRESKCNIFKFDFCSGVFELGDQFSDGNGGWLIEDYINNHNSIVEPLEVGLNIESTTISALSHFIATEGVSGDFLENSSGGGFDSIYWNGGEFVAPPEFSVFIANINCDGNIMSAHVSHAIDFKAVGSSLLYRRFNLRQGPRPDIISVSNQTDMKPYAIPSITDEGVAQLGRLILDFPQDLIDNLNEPIRDNHISLAVFCRQHGRLVYMIEQYSKDNPRKPIEIQKPSVANGNFHVYLRDINWRAYAGLAHAPAMKKFGER